MTHWEGQDQMTEILNHRRLIYQRITELAITTSFSLKCHLVGSLSSAGPLHPQLILMLLTQEKGQGLLSGFLVFLPQASGFPA